MKEKYMSICKAILKQKDFRMLLRKWIMLIEETRVVGWNRDEFLECFIKYKKEVEGNEKK